MKTISSGYSCAKRIKTDGRVILADVFLDASVRESLFALRTIDGKELIIIDAQETAALLEDFLEKFVYQNMLFVFPGNGSNYPKSFSDICKRSNSAGVVAKRFWTPGSTPFVMAGAILPEIFMHLSTQTILVVDDVISSGQTMHKLWQNNEPRFPGAKWIGVAWLSQRLKTRPLSGITGYDSVFASIMVEGISKRLVPINSLSTLREQPSIAESYARRHFIKHAEFLRLIRRKHASKLVCA